MRNESRIQSCKRTGYTSTDILFRKELILIYEKFKVILGYYRLRRNTCIRFVPACCYKQIKEYPKEKQSMNPKKISKKRREADVVT